ncbi:MAG: hypothetical protein M0015_10395 [Betaproteobacteria bacterium]|nr:hypothetical protein [Betaproteobacteria bacterium]
MPQDNCAADNRPVRNRNDDVCQARLALEPFGKGAVTFFAGYGLAKTLRLHHVVDKLLGVPDGHVLVCGEKLRAISEPLSDGGETLGALAEDVITLKRQHRDQRTNKQHRSTRPKGTECA